MQYSAVFSVMLLMVMAVDVCSVDPAPSRDDDRRSPNPVHAGLDRQSVNGANKREKILKILTSLEEVQRSMNSTLNSRIAVMPRAGVRGSGKKSKGAMSVEVLRTTTAPPVDNGGTSSQVSDNSHDRYGLGGKGLKKSASQPPRKPNKRVCFWKYCSQN